MCNRRAKSKGYKKAMKRQIKDLLAKGFVKAVRTQEVKTWKHKKFLGKAYFCQACNVHLKTLREVCGHMNAKDTQDFHEETFRQKMEFLPEYRRYLEAAEEDYGDGETSESDDE